MTDSELDAILSEVIPSAEETKRFDDELIKRMREGDKKLDTFNFDLDNEETIDIDNSEQGYNKSICNVNLDHLKYNSEGKILISSLPDD